MIQGIIQGIIQGMTQHMIHDKGHPPRGPMVKTRPFKPFRGCSNNHIQTILGTLRPPKPEDFPHEALHVRLFDGDQLILRLNGTAPPRLPSSEHKDSEPEKPLVLLLHGLGGSSESSYILRLTAKLNQQGFLVTRFNHRGCAPEGISLAQGIYHAGRTEDIDATMLFLRERFPLKKIIVAGFSLSANMLLKFLGERYRPKDHTNLLGALAVNPPIDLQTCSVALCRKDNFYIDRLFTGMMLRMVEARATFFPEEPSIIWPSKMSLRIFDEIFTAPRAGFRSRDEYYQASSSKNHLHKIKIPTQILAAQDDPIIPAATFKNLDLSPMVSLRLEAHGGHLGYIGRHKTCFGDRRWMDEFISHWIEGLLEGSS